MHNIKRRAPCGFQRIALPGCYRPRGLSVALQFEKGVRQETPHVELKAAQCLAPLGVTIP